MSQAIQLSIDLKFPDDVDRSCELHLDTTSAFDALDLTLVISTLPALHAEFEERIVESMHLAVVNWCLRHDIALVSDPATEIRSKVREILPTPLLSATQPQIDGVERFEEWTHRNAALSTIRRVINVADLELSELGAIWGVTAFPNSGIALRLNVGNRYIASIRSGGSLRLYCIGDAVIVPDVGGVRIDEGFEKVDGSYSLIAEEGPATAAVLDDLEIQRQHRSFVAAHQRRLSRSNWHNPLTEPLLGLK